jgi:uncharacterized protein with PQ loop repeat
MNSEIGTEAVGWVSAALLLATIVQQVYTQWTSGKTEGVSPWLFVGQTLASLGFSIYSVMTGNVVFIVVNVALLFSALVGQAIYWRNCRREAATKNKPTNAPPCGKTGEPLRGT